MAKKFPKTLFVRVRSDDTEWFQADEDANSFVDMGDKIKVARYELKETFTAEGVVKLT